MVWRYGGPIVFNLALTVSEKRGFMDGQTMDACPHDDNSTAVQLHKAELKARLKVPN